MSSQFSIDVFDVANKSLHSITPTVFCVLSFHLSLRDHYTQSVFCFKQKLLFGRVLKNLVPALVFELLNYVDGDLPALFLFGFLNYVFCHIQCLIGFCGYIRNNAGSLPICFGFHMAHFIDRQDHHNSVADINAICFVGCAC